MMNFPIYQQQPQSQPQFPQQAATPLPGMPNYGQPTYGQPAGQPGGQPFGQPSFPQAAAAQPYMPPQAPAGNAGWQPNPVLAAQALGTNQPRARGYAPDPTPTPTAPPPTTFAAVPLTLAPPAELRLPLPEDLGVGRAAAPVAPAAPVADVVDWNQAHARMRDLGVARFNITRVAGGVRVSMELAGGRTIDGLGASEATALAMAFDRAK